MKTAKRFAYVALLLALLALAADPSLGAVEKSDWSSLKQIAAGQTVKVTVGKKSFQADFQSATEDMLVLHTDGGGEARIAREMVGRVCLKMKGHRGKHALIGAAIGGGAGLGAGIAIDNHCSATSIVCTGNKGKGILTPAFALIGAGIGALLPAGGWREIYRAG